METLYVCPTMDCEPVRDEVPEDVRSISLSGPESWEQSERAIRGYIRACGDFHLPVTLFVHPEVAAAHRDMLLEAEAAGACLGLHIHPYKLAGSEYKYDVGAYTAAEQLKMIREASAKWEEILGRGPLYFRGGYFSANDATFSVLTELGFFGGSLSNPGRVLPGHYSVWAGAPDYIHPVHPAFRQAASEDYPFIEVPVAVDYSRPVSRGAAGEAGFEWPYAAAFSYDHKKAASNIVDRLIRENNAFPLYVTDVHNDQELGDLGDPALRNFKEGVETVFRRSEEEGFAVKGTTVRDVINEYKNQ